MRVEKPREIAVHILGRHVESGRWLEDLLARELSSQRLAPADRALVQEMVYGSVRHQALLDWMIARRTDGRDQPALMRALLRIALYQLFFLDRIPDHAAVNEAVESARRLGFPAQAGFVNALLRGCLREREALESEMEVLRARQPEIGYSHPRWLCERWSARYTVERMRELLSWNNQPPRVFARLNTLKSTPEGWRDRLISEGVEATPIEFDWVPAGWMVRLDRFPPVDTLPSFREGWFYIQDPSTLLAVTELSPQPGEAVLDLCAAPGGKTTAIAQLMNDRGRITAYDPDGVRRGLIRENCERLGLKSVRVPEGRAARPGESFDRILIDAPCSNTGVMRRRAELRWRITEAEITRLRGVQLGLLRQAAGCLAPGGKLVYSTCSLEPEENEGVVAEFLAESAVGGWHLVRQRQLSPLVEGVDGAFVAVLQKPLPRA